MYIALPKLQVVFFFALVNMVEAVMLLLPRLGLQSKHSSDEWPCLNQTKCVKRQMMNMCKHKFLNTGQVIEVRSGQTRISRETCEQVCNLSSTYL